MFKFIFRALFRRNHLRSKGQIAPKVAVEPFKPAERRIQPCPKQSPDKQKHNQAFDGKTSHPVEHISIVEPFKPAERRIQLPPKQTPDKQKHNQAFDSKTSHRVEHIRILEGPAFVTDGDTITIRKTQIRLFGIDAPELNHPFGQKAKWAMVKLCKGQKVSAFISDVDAYGRTVAKCYLPDGRDLSAELVKKGLAIDWPKFSGGKYSELEVEGVRTKLWLADARQKGRMHVWEKFEAKKLEDN